MLRKSLILFLQVGHFLGWLFSKHFEQYVR